LRVGQDTQFVVHKHVMFGRVALLDIVEFLLLVHVNEHTPGDSIGQSGATDLERLENDVAVRENDHRNQSLYALNHFEGIGQKAPRERIVDKKIRDAEQIQGAWAFGPISLQSAKVIRIPKFGPELLENPPVFLRSLRAQLGGEMALQICCHSVVIQQRVVY